MRNKIYAAALVALCLMGCKGTNNGGQTGDEAEIQTLTYDTLKLSKKSTVIEGHELPNYEIEIKCAYATNDNAVADSVNASICEMLFGNRDGVLKDLMSQFVNNLA
ncbi:MAG: hypothetical protein HUK03_10555, partial [Bacteroidaceae bacterium]|nr:hypothetical protein [Bacteroidaceae bacterium]